jgi:hypothetical protein
MTNTRCTDVEILERRYPVLLHEVHPSLRQDRHLQRDVELHVADDTVSAVPATFAARTRGRNLWIKQRRREDGDWKENDSTPR